MDAMINSLNTEIVVFLQNLRKFAADQQVAIPDQKVVIGKRTVDLLYEIVSFIEEELMKKSDVIDVANEINPSFLNDLDQSHFELHRNIVCRLCNISMPVTREDFHAHVREDSHLNRLPRLSLMPRISRPLVATHNMAMKHSPTSSESEAEILKKDIMVFETDSSEAEFKVETSLPKQNDSFGFEDCVGTGWAKAVSVSNSDSSFDASQRGFNYDTKYLILMRNLPWSATKPQIAEFLGNVSILNGLDGIHFIINEMDMKKVEAYIQLEQLREYMAALKMNGKCMDDQLVEVLPVQQSHQFNSLVKARKIPSKERVVFIENLPPKYSEQDIRTFFTELLIDVVQFTQSGKHAYVKFITIDDVEFAIKRNDKKSQMRIYRSSQHQMQNDCEEDKGHSSLRYPSAANSRRDSIKIAAKTDGSHCSMNFLKIKGLSWTINKSYIVDLFPGLTIDESNGIQMERDAKGRFNGIAIVHFKNADDYEMVIKQDLSPTSPHIKLSRATQAEFIQAKEANDRLNSNT